MYVLGIAIVVSNHQTCVKIELTDGSTEPPVAKLLRYSPPKQIVGRERTEIGLRQNRRHRVNRARYESLRLPPVAISIAVEIDVRASWTSVNEAPPACNWRKYFTTVRCSSL